MYSIEARGYAVYNLSQGNGFLSGSDFGGIW